MYFCIKNIYLQVKSIYLQIIKHLQKTRVHFMHNIYSFLIFFSSSKKLYVNICFFKIL